eukprot:3502713-Pleurochrysis_carterae.AAC.2
MGARMKILRFDKMMITCSENSGGGRCPRSSWQAGPTLVKQATLQCSSSGTVSRTAKITRGPQNGGAGHHEEQPHACRHAVLEREPFV